MRDALESFGPCCCCRCHVFRQRHEDAHHPRAAAPSTPALAQHLLTSPSSAYRPESKQQALPVQVSPAVEPQPRRWFGCISCSRRKVLSVPACAPDVLPLDPWVPPKDELEAEWAAVARTISAFELGTLQGFRDLVRSKGLDYHEACTAAGAEQHSQKAATLLRFMRARPGNIQAALDLLEEALNWRRDFGIDRKLREWRVEWAEGSSVRVRLIKKYTYMGLLGKDREGLPVYVHRHSQGDLGGMVREVGQEPMLLYMVSQIEDQFACAHTRMLKTGRCINNFVEIHDLGRYGHVGSYLPRAFAASSFFKTYAPVFDKVYPERVRVVFLVRMPSAFAVVWRLCSPLVPEATKSKLRLMGFQSSTWQQEMSDLMPRETIPGWLRTDLAEEVARATPWAGIVPKDAIRTFEAEDHHA